MKTIKHEIKLERSVKLILGVFAVGILLNAFSTPIAQEMLGIKDSMAEIYDGSVLNVWIQNCKIDRKESNWPIILQFC